VSRAPRTRPSVAPLALRAVLALLALGVARLPPGAAAQEPPQGFVPVLDADGFVRATAGRPLVLPADHGSHPETRTEWWYLTGALTTEDGAELGFQATWFRRALVAEVPVGRSPLAVRDVLLYHGALTDLAAGRLSFHEQSCRAFEPWAHAATGALDVALLEHTLRADGAGAAPGSVRLRCRAGEGVLDLELDFGAAVPLLHGEEPGLSIKGREPGQASFYYSLPRIACRGTLARPAPAGTVAVSGLAWFDHEFGSSQLSAEQVGWDWYSVALDDGTDLMLYRMRLADGTADATSAGTLRTPDGVRTHLRRDDITLTPLGSWTSPRTGARYPSGWELSIPAHELVLRVQPALADQELSSTGSTGVNYWEGLCRYAGTRAGRAVSGKGYVELVGYDGRFRERL
jgi:predicted secreted hydrolase